MTCSAERAGLRLTPLTTTRSRGLALLLFGYGKLTAIAGTTEYMGSLGLPAPSPDDTNLRVMSDPPGRALSGSVLVPCRCRAATSRPHVSRFRWLRRRKLRYHLSATWARKAEHAAVGRHREVGEVASHHGP